VIAHLARGSAVAMSLARNNERKGQLYCAEFSAWLRDEGLDDISKTTRCNALQCADHFDVIEVFLDTLEPDKRLKLNHPASVLAAWKRSQTNGKPLKPKVTLSAAWGAATAEERSAWVKNNEKNVFAAMSSEQRQRLAQHVLNLHRKKPKFHEDLTDLFRKAWLHVDGGTCMEALACLRAIQRVATGANLKFDDLVVAA
jgi:hypothetical protein